MSDEWTFDEELAATMDAGPDLLPWLPELFQDLEDLGARSEDVVTILEEVQLPPSARVLDLGCGKGAALIALAQARPIDGVGVDAMGDFVRHATERARAKGLDQHVRFKEGDILDVVKEVPPGSVDLVSMLALGPVLGDLQETVGALRPLVRPGGHILIDDAYLAPGVQVDDPLLRECVTRETALRELQRYGDRLVAERAYEDAGYHAWCHEMTGKVLTRAEDLARRTPEIREAVLSFARRQREETEALTGPLVGALWLLERGSD